MRSELHPQSSESLPPTHRGSAAEFQRRAHAVGISRQIEADMSAYMMMIRSLVTGYARYGAGHVLRGYDPYRPPMRTNRLIQLSRRFAASMQRQRAMTAT